MGPLSRQRQGDAPRVPRVVRTSLSVVLHSWGGSSSTKSNLHKLQSQDGSHDAATSAALFERIRGAPLRTRTTTRTLTDGSAGSDEHHDEEAGQYGTARATGTTFVTASMGLDGRTIEVRTESVQRIVTVTVTTYRDGGAEGRGVRGRRERGHGGGARAVGGRRRAAIYQRRRHGPVQAESEESSTGEGSDEGETSLSCSSRTATDEGDSVRTEDRMLLQLQLAAATPSATATSAAAGTCLR